MQTHTYFSNDDQITLINMSNGNRVTIYNDDPRFQSFKDLIIKGAYDEAEKLDTKVAVKNFVAKFTSGHDFGIEITDGVGKVNIKGNTYPLQDVIVKRIIKMIEEGFDAQPLVNFLCNLYENPSKTAVNELFLFMEHSELPITEDGYLIAYKIVRDDYFDIYSGKFDNSVGKVVEMPRFEVDDNRSNTCSSGLHFCSKEYLPYYGTKKGDRCMLVKINPRDIVSIPNDYNNAKGRTCRYEVVGEVTTDEWRKFLADRDYNDKSVVKDDGSDVVLSVSDSDPDSDSDSLSWENLYGNGFFFDKEKDIFRFIKDNVFAPRSLVARHMGVSVEDLYRFVHEDRPVL